MKETKQTKNTKTIWRNIGNIIRNSFIIKNKTRKKKIKGRMIRDIRKPFEEEEKKEKKN